MNSYFSYLKEIKRRKYIILISQIMITIIFLFIWDLFSRLSLIDSFIFSSPKRIFDTLLIYTKSKEIFYHIMISSYEVLLGLFIGTVLGLIIAVILYEIPILYKIFDPFLVIFNALPKTALAPIFIIWIGTNTKGIVFVSISISLIITIVSGYGYFSSVDVEKIKMMKSFKANRLEILRYLILPANFDNIMNLIKINIGMSWIGVIVGEFIVSKAGLGYLITYGTSVFKLDLVMGAIFVLAVITFLMYGILNLIYKLIKKIKGW